VKRGWTVLLPGLGSRPQELQAVLSALVRQTPEVLPGAAPLARVDGLADGHFATETGQGVLWYQGEDGTIRGEEGAAAPAQP
jgi:hypothetical protein